MKTRPYFLLSALAIVGALFAVAAMSLTNAKSGVLPPEGFKSTILALEFAQDNAVIERVFQWSDSAMVHYKLQCFDLGVNLDYLFILAYGGFMLFFALESRRQGLKTYWLGLALGIIAVFADVMENSRLKAIFQLAEGGQYDFTAHFAWLHFWTCLKFFAIGAYFLAFAPLLWRGNWLGKMSVLAACAALFFWVAAGFYQPEFWADTMFSMIFFAFAGAMLFGLRYRVEPQNDPSL